MLLTVNGEPRKVPPGATIAQLLAELKLPSRGVAVEVNLQLVPRARHAEFLLSDGDTLEVVSLVGGG
jgi:thiamine biosynthesis protein ThiS